MHLSPNLKFILRIEKFTFFTFRVDKACYNICSYKQNLFARFAPGPRDNEALYKALKGGATVQMNKKPDEAENQPGENQAANDRLDKAKQTGKKAGLIALKAAGFTVDAASSVVGTMFKLLGSLLLVFLLTGMLFTCVFAYYVKTCLTPELRISLEDFQLNESSTLWYQGSGGQWQELVTVITTEKRIWVDYDKIPKYMEQALVAIEDKRFYEHKGVDWYRTAGAFVEMFARMEGSYGGSTITQQLIKNLTGEDEVTIQRKLTEIFSALDLEKRYDKEDIVLYYLNAVYFGESCYGVQAAAQTYFGKDVSELSLAECASIVGITNKPTLYDPFYNQQKNKERQEIILREMYEQGYIDYATYKDAVAEELVFAHSPNEEAPMLIYSYYEEVVINDVIKDLMELKGISREAAWVLLETGGYQIYCCLNPNIQAVVDSVYTDLSAIPRASRSDQQFQSAIVIMNPYDGSIVALSGGVGEKTLNYGLNRATGTQRPAGSSIKPIASYGPAVEAGLITPNTVVNDSPSIRLSGTSWYPSNDGGGNMGVVTIYQALQYSLNTVAAQIIDKLTPQRAYDFLVTRLGVTSLVPDDASYAPMALGQLTNGITVREMAQAYGAFVNDGIFTYSRTYSMLTDAKGNVVIDNSPKTIVAFSPNTAYVMSYMLKNAAAAGTGTEANFWSMPVAGKTGTTTDYKDRWFVGYTPYYVAAVWTGFDIPERIYTSGNPAAQLWRKVMAPIHEGLEYKDFPWPYIGENTGIFGLEDADDDKYAGGDVYIDDDSTGNGNSGNDYGDYDGGGFSGTGDVYA